MAQVIGTRERRIKELQQALANAHGSKEATDNDYMEMAITNQRLQRDHNELVEAVKKQKRTHEATMDAHKRQAQHQQHQQASIHTTAHTGISSTTLDDMRCELHDNHIYISQMQNKAER
jgi:chromosome segregation ATPase